MIFPNEGFCMETVIDVDGTDGPRIILAQLAYGMEQDVRVDPTAIGDLYRGTAPEVVMQHAR
jgi:hypothetical protein